MYRGKITPFFETDEKYVSHTEERKRISDSFLSCEEKPQKKESLVKKESLLNKDPLIIFLISFLLLTKEKKDPVLLGILAFLLI